MSRRFVPPSLVPGVLGVAGILVALGALPGLPRDALANGRLPATSSITFRQGHESDIVAGVTFGVAISHDGGATWAWMCDDALGIGGSPYDPLYSYTPAGTLFATTLTGLIVMRDGCTFNPAPSGKAFVSAHALGPDGAFYYAAAQTAVNGSSSDFKIYKSIDDGMTFPVSEQPDDPGDVNVLWQSIMVAPNNKSIVYLSGSRYIPVSPGSTETKRDYLLYRSDDGGASWAPQTPPAPTTSGLTLTPPNSLIHIVGIASDDPKHVYARVGNSDDPHAFSLIAIHTHGLPTVFSEAALALAEKAKPVALGHREDLRPLPLVTIDGADARDFDDAVWAEPDPERPDGFHAVVAIADVAWYVRPGDALDDAARERGNSAYFPDRVVPMLPEALSNELCSLKPDVDRACLAVHLWIDTEGNVDRHRFVHGLMRSAARLTYEEAQAAQDGRPDDATRPLVKSVLAPLYGAFRALDRARRRRGALDLDLPERRILLEPNGRIARIEPRERLDSHRLIEELMIAANVAAAETLERLKQPCMYRVHDSPDPAKLVALREFLEGIGIPGLKLAKGQVVRPRHFNEILRHASGTPYETLIHQLVLRSQAQAVYSPANLGHFGLGLQRYAHFTSPIRRYSDLLVHRALITGHRFGVGGLIDDDPKSFAAVGEHISMTERRAAAAERSATDRYVTAFLAERRGASFAARINGVTRAGLFITLAETGADGLIPMRNLPGDYYEHDEARHRLIGRRTRRTFTLGDPVTARLAEANAVTGSLLFALETEEPATEAPRPTKHRARRGR